MKKTNKIIKFIICFIVTFILFCYVDGNFFMKSGEKIIQLISTIFLIGAWEINEDSNQ
jgi:YbbR domain-containing protein